MLDTRKMLSDVNGEIQRLTKIRDLLTVDTSNGAVPVDKLAIPAPPKPARKKRHLSPEGRAAIAAATKRRWDAARKLGKQMNGIPLNNKGKKKAKRTAPVLAATTA